MAGASKNSRTTVATQKFICPDCGGEIIMKTMIDNGKLKNQAECQKCKRVERRPKDFNYSFATCIVGHRFVFTYKKNL
ncbi:MAG: hypothetical protein GX677_05225 [Treponema sp.]|nr:hypothetical protein [Treponema sp.]